MEHWDVLDRLPVGGHARIWRRDDGTVDIDMKADGLSRRDVERIAQHLLEAAGHSTADVIKAIAPLLRS